jgi:hypothetical protein
MSSVSRAEMWRSAMWGAAISVPVTVCGYIFSFALMHSELKPLAFVLLAPAIGVLETIQRLQPATPNAMRFAAALTAQWLIYSVVVLAFRALQRMERNR